MNNPYGGVFLDMGLGKTVVTLTVIDNLLFDTYESEKVLIIAPKRVAKETWPDEIQKWDHLKHLRYSLVLGVEKDRLQALKVKAEIYIINRENVAWLVARYQNKFPFDTVIFDESSSFKSSKAIRFRAIKRVLPFINRSYILTGTPVPNGLIDIWPQIYLLDQGKRLGVNVTDYRNNYFQRSFSSAFKYEIRDNAEKEIHAKIKDICISMQAKDYLQLPETVIVNRVVTMSKEQKKLYNAFEETQVLKIFEKEDARDISAINAAVLQNKLLQFANGAIYDEEKKVHTVHDAKLEVLEEIIDTAAGHPVLVFYNYKHDLARIQERLKAYKPVVLKDSKDIQAWNRKEIPVYLVHPKSGGYGLNLQTGGNIIVWFGLTWSLEDYMQGNKRLDRQGQTQAVIIHHLISKGTVDETVIRALIRKENVQEALLTATRVLINKYIKTAA